MNNTVDYTIFTNIDTLKEERYKLHVGDIFLNQIRCLLCLDEIRSKNRYNMVTCKCGNCHIDGGSHYQHIGAKDLNAVEDISVMYNDVKQ